MLHIHLSTGEEIVVTGTSTANTIDIGSPRHEAAVSGLVLLLQALDKRDCLFGDIDGAVEDALINIGTLYG